MRVQRSPEANTGDQGSQINTNNISAWPIPATDRNLLYSSRYEAMTQSDNNELLFIDSIVNVKILIEYYKSYENSLFLGLRFYPGYDNSNTIFSVLCLSSETEAHDADHILLRDTNIITTLIPTTATIARSYINQYWTNVFIDGQPQSLLNRYYKKSRYFSWETILIYLSANIPNFDANDPLTFENYSLNFEHAFCNTAMAERFIGYGINLFPGMVAIDLCGYAIMMQVLDQQYNSMIDPNAIYQEGNYAGRHLEISKPCPPFCGDTF